MTMVFGAVEGVVYPIAPFVGILLLFLLGGFLVLHFHAFSVVGLWLIALFHSSYSHPCVSYIHFCSGGVSYIFTLFSS